MQDHVVVDVEIAKTIEETEGGWNATDKLGVAVACLWEYRTQRMRIYGPEDVPALQARLQSADRISGYNIWGFDYPVIWGQNKNNWKDISHDFCAKLKDKLFPKTDDLLRRIWAALGINPDKGPAGLRGTSLEAITSATLGAGKIGSGESAPRWYQEGRVQKVCNYCCDDTALERDLCDFIDRYGYVLHDGKKLLIKKWE